MAANKRKDPNGKRPWEGQRGLFDGGTSSNDTPLIDGTQRFQPGNAERYPIQPSSISSLPPEYWQGVHQGKSTVVGYVGPAKHDPRRTPAAPFVRVGTPPPFAFHPTGLDRVWAGRNPLSGNDARKLWELGITHVLDLREPGEWQAPRAGQAALDMLEKKGIVRLSVPIEDATAPSDAELEAGVDFLHAALSGNPEAKAYVHCRAGKGRTGCFLLAYAALHAQGTVAQAYQALDKSYPLFQPLGHQEMAVRRWHAPRLQVPLPGVTGATVQGATTLTLPPGTVLAAPNGGRYLPCDSCSTVFEVGPTVLSFVCRPCYYRELGLDAQGNLIPGPSDERAVTLSPPPRGGTKGGKKGGRW